MTTIYAIYRGGEGEVLSLACFFRGAIRLVIHGDLRIREGERMKRFSPRFWGTFYFLA